MNMNSNYDCMFRQTPTTPMTPGVAPVGMPGAAPMGMPNVGAGTATAAPYAPYTPYTPYTPYAPYNVQPPFDYTPTTILPPDFEFEPGAPVQKNVLYTQGYLRTQIGKRVKIEFLIGTNMLIDREGTLLDVGISYVILQEVETDDHLLCDIYSIKFVRIYY